MSLEFSANWELLQDGPPEERACFAAIGILADNVSLAEAEDLIVRRTRSENYLSAYRLGEWLAWNWWRLRWEPYTRAPDWAMAHRLATIGGGFVWPNITIVSDGEEVRVVAKPTEPREAEPVRYIADFVATVPAVEFEGAVASLVEQVIDRLQSETVPETNLERIWRDVREEISSPEIAFRRRLEALLGFDPEEAPAGLVGTYLSDGEDLGTAAVDELAALCAGGKEWLTGEIIHEIANALGIESNLNDGIETLATICIAKVEQQSSVLSAWQRGAEFAHVIRDQEQLGASPISNQRLADWTGIQTNFLTRKSSSTEKLAFALQGANGRAQIVFRSKWETGRRFELARLLGDRIARTPSDRLFPATHGRTYRQKFQRSFAAELLCPFEALDDMLAGDFSDEKQDEVANYFSVSPITVRTLLVNHGRIDRHELELEADLYGPM